MSQSPEYPDLKWVPPKSWTDANRQSVQLVVIHTTEGSAHTGSAEDGAAYDARRTDGTSTHYFHDNDSTVQCVRTDDQAHTARSQGNRRGIQHELCGKAGWSAAAWQGDYQQAMLRRAAKQAARDARRWDIPIRHLTAAQVADGVKGFCGHWDISRAFPADNGTHTDPGPNFPWSQFLDMVRDWMDGDEDIMAITDEDLAKIAKAVWAADVIPVGNTTWGAGGTLGVLYESMPARVRQALSADLSGILTVASRDDVDEQALAAALAPAVASLVIANLPHGTDQVSQEEVNAAVKAAFRDAFAD